MNKIFHYRVDGTHDECAGDNPWGQCLFNNETNLDDFSVNHLVTIGGQPIISQHEATYITGRDTCHAHHFAKMLAGAVLANSYQHAPSLTASPTVPVTFELPRDPGPDSRPHHCTKSATPGTVLWIDTIHSPYDCAKLYREMKDNFCFKDGAFSLFCLDMLGVFREDYYQVIRTIEAYIHDLKPALIVIDDIDHFMPYCGINVASTFCNIFRDTLNHTETAFLLIGYNHLGKRTSTTGDLGKLLFPRSNSVFSVTTQNAISHVRIVRALEYSSFDEPEFIFTIGKGNIPHEMVKTIPSGNISPTFVEQCALQDIISDVVEPGEAITPDELVTRVSKRQSQLNRIDRARTLVAQALTYGMIKKDNESNRYSLIPSNLENTINTSLTFPPHPSTNKTEAQNPMQPTTATPSSSPIVNVLRASGS